MRERARLPADVQEDEITLWRQRKSRPNGRAPHPKGQAGIQVFLFFLSPKRTSWNSRVLILSCCVLHLLVNILCLVTIRYFWVTKSRV